MNKTHEKISHLTNDPVSCNPPHGLNVKNVNADIAIKSVKGGQIRVGFKINTAGKVEDIHLRKSVEYIRRRGTRVISKIDLIPAEKDGVKLDAYRIQPVAFVKSK